MPTVLLHGVSVNMTDAQYQQYLVQQGKAAAPAPNPATQGRTLGVKTHSTNIDPCAAYATAQQRGMSKAVQDSLRAKCQAYQQAQAFAASPAAMTTASEAVSEDAGTEPNKKKLLLLVGAAALVGLGITWYMTRR